MLVHIGKDVSIRDFVMKRSDISGIIELARRMNPDIYIGHMTAEEKKKVKFIIAIKKETDCKCGLPPFAFLRCV